MSAEPAPGISRTSVYVAAGRATGAREPDPSVRNPDDLVERLLGDVSTLDIDQPAIHALRLDESPEQRRYNPRTTRRHQSGTPPVAS